MLLQLLPKLTYISFVHQTWMRSWCNSLKKEVHLVMHRFNLELNPGSIFVRYWQWIMFDMTIYDIKSSMMYWGNVQKFCPVLFRTSFYFLAMRIHISSETADALRNWKAFKISLRGQMDMKVWSKRYLRMPSEFKKSFGHLSSYKHLGLFSTIQIAYLNF